MNIISENEIINVLKALGLFKDSKNSANEIKRYTSGFINETIGFQDLIVKINARRECFFLGNRFISDHFARSNDGDRSKVVRVVDYDLRERTPYEVLVMRRSEGSLLETDLPKMSKSEIESVFRQTIRLMKRCHEIRFERFGEFKDPSVAGPSPSFASASEYLSWCFDEDTEYLIRKRLADAEDVERIRRYFKEYVPLFDAGEERPCFVHRDVRWANILHRNGELTAVIDFDMACSGQARFLSQLKFMYI